MPGESRERKRLAQLHSDELEKLPFAERILKIEEYVVEGLRLASQESTGLRRNWTWTPQVLGPAAAPPTAELTVDQVLKINARYYESEFFGPINQDDVFCPDPELCDNDDPKKSDTLSISKVLNTADVLFERTASEWNVSDASIASYRRMKTAFMTRQNDPWPTGCVIGPNYWKKTLPRDRAAPTVCLDNGDSIPPKTFKNVHYSDLAEDLHPPFCNLDKKPDFSGKTPVEIEVELETRMVCNVAAIRRNRDSRVTTSMFEAMIQRALRSEAIFRCLKPLRDLINDELERRRRLDVPSILESRVAGANASEMAEVLLPYIPLPEAMRLKSTCRTLRNWCSANGVFPRLALGCPDTEDDFDFGAIECHSKCAETGVPEAVHGKMIAAYPTLYYQRQTMKPTLSTSHVSTHVFSRPSDRIAINHCNADATRFSIELVEDNDERTPIVGFGGASEICFGASDNMQIDGTKATPKTHAITELKFAVFSRPSKHWGNRRLRARITLHVACLDAYGRPQPGPTIMGESDPFLIISREHAESTKRLAKSRDRDKAHNRRMFKLSARMQQRGVRRQRAMDHANQQN